MSKCLLLRTAEMQKARCAEGRPVRTQTARCVQRSVDEMLYSIVDAEDETPPEQKTSPGARSRAQRRGHPVRGGTANDDGLDARSNAEAPSASEPPPAHDAGAASQWQTPRRRQQPVPAALKKLRPLLAVEDPFNEEDNTSRSVGAPERFRAIVAAFVSAALSGGSALHSLCATPEAAHQERPPLRAPDVARRAAHVHLRAMAATTAEVRASASVRRRSSASALPPWARI